MKNSTAKSGKQLSAPEIVAKKLDQTKRKSARQKERRAEKKAARAAVIKSLPWMRGNPPGFGSRAQSKIKPGVSYAWHVSLKLTGDIDANAEALQDWYSAFGQNKFTKQPKGNAYTVYPFLTNQTPEYMAERPFKNGIQDVRTNAEILTQMIVEEIYERGADNIKVQGVFVHGNLTGGKGLK